MLKFPPWLNALCAAASTFVHFTLSPELIVRLAGTNRKFWIETLAVAALGAALADEVRPMKRSAIAARESRTARIVSRIRYE